MCRAMLPEGHIIQQATSLEEMNSVTDKGTIFVTEYYLTYGSARWFKLERLPTRFLFRAAEPSHMVQFCHVIACWKAE